MTFPNVLVRLEHLCTPCTFHPCSNRSENLPGSYHLLPKNENKTSVLLLKKLWRLFHVLFLDLRQTCSISHFMCCKATAVYIDFVTYYIMNAVQCSSVTLCYLSLLINIVVWCSDI
jgi:hypothetical protein